MKNLKNFIVTQQEKCAKPRKLSSMKFNGIEIYSLNCSDVTTGYRTISITIDAYVKSYRFSFYSGFCRMKLESKVVSFAFSNEVAITFCTGNTELQIRFDNSQDDLNDIVDYGLMHYERLKSEQQFMRVIMFRTLIKRLKIV
jgi:hypothetical protein